ncbi:Fe-S cluster assembly sulfur transfer protein SufU [Nitrosomonas sp.]|uniref:Fe-S cluster assembly sulfur transfer protein SufU n=1 Tax=Nitrosomonas sp. TaxID=42353 RepID=UPI002618A119|nr:SUF system NifU family Fe-S cluster assembly protein [Nitrosomonas sp.]MCW5602500.1 SUF system NifU family Fe-S cluster assembly protein [Nitrosomonas sp.]
MNLKSIYQEVILDHNRKPRNYGTLDDANHQALGHNPLCGDRIEVALHLEGEKIDRIAFHGESCAICKASASMMTANVKGKSRAEAETLIKEFREMVVGDLDLEGPHHLGRLAVFAGVRDLPTRVKCAILPWHTLHAALNSVAMASTEATENSAHTATNA